MAIGGVMIPLVCVSPSIPNFLPLVNSQKILFLLVFLKARNSHVAHVWLKQPKFNFIGILFERQFAENK